MAVKPAAQSRNPLCAMTPVLLDTFHGVLRPLVEEDVRLGQLPRPVREWLGGWLDSGLPALDAAAVGRDGYRAGYLLCIAEGALRCTPSEADEKFRDSLCQQRVDSWVKALTRGRPGRRPRNLPERLTVGAWRAGFRESRESLAGKTAEKAQQELAFALPLSLSDAGVAASQSSPNTLEVFAPRRGAGRPGGPTTETVVRAWTIDALCELARLHLHDAIDLWNHRFRALQYLDNDPDDRDAHFRVDRDRTRGLSRLKARRMLDRVRGFQRFHDFLRHSTDQRSSS
jgi:hypothetical protein